MKIGIIIAMDIEYRKMLDVLGGQPQGTVAGNDVVLWQCGIGKVNAAVGTMRLIASSARVLQAASTPASTSWMSSWGARLSTMMFGAAWATATARCKVCLPASMPTP